MSLAPALTRVSRRHPCPICHRADWCVFEGPADRPTRVFCPRVESDRRAGELGFIHVLDGGEADTPVPKPEPKEISYDGWAILAAQYQANLDLGRLDAFAEGLGVTSDSLRQLQVGWSGSAWTFPMFDPRGRPTGIRLRRPNGFRYSVTDSTNGLFMAPTPGPTSWLWVAEGETDTAALRSIGLNAIGRPGALSCIEQVVEVAASILPEVLIIVADADKVGRAGAYRLQEHLLEIDSLTMVIDPPLGAPDAREAVRSGATSANFEEAARATVAIEHRLDLGEGGQGR